MLPVSPNPMVFPASGFESWPIHGVIPMVGSLKSRRVKIHGEMEKWRLYFWFYGKIIYSPGIYGDTLWKFAT
jgi:hypothetical protein